MNNIVHKLVTNQSVNQYLLRRSQQVILFFNRFILMFYAILLKFIQETILLKPKVDSIIKMNWSINRYERRKLFISSQVTGVLNNPRHKICMHCCVRIKIYSLAWKQQFWVFTWAQLIYTSSDPFATVRCATSLKVMSATSHRDSEPMTDVSTW